MHVSKQVPQKRKGVSVAFSTMEKDEVENLVTERVTEAVRSTQNDLLTGIQHLISSEVDKISERQKTLSELQLSKIAALTPSAYKFKRKSNEEQYKVNSKVLGKVQDCERNIDQAELSQAKENLAEGIWFIFRFISRDSVQDASMSSLESIF